MNSNYEQLMHEIKYELINLKIKIEPLAINIENKRIFNYELLEPISYYNIVKIRELLKEKYKLTDIEFNDNEINIKY